MTQRKRAIGQCESKKCNCPISHNVAKCSLTCKLFFTPDSNRIWSKLFIGIAQHYCISDTARLPFDSITVATNCLRFVAASRLIVPFAGHLVFGRPSRKLWSASATVWLEPRKIQIFKNLKSIHESEKIMLIATQ